MRGSPTDERLSPATATSRSRAGVRHATAVLAPLLATLIHAGCASTPTTRDTGGELLTQSNRPEVIAPEGPASDDALTSMDDLAARTQEDAAFIRGWLDGDRAGIAAPVNQPTEQSPDDADASRDRSRSVAMSIDWNTPDREPLRRDEKEASRSEGRPGAFAIPEDTFEQSSLFRTPEAWRDAAEADEPPVEADVNTPSLRPRVLDQLLVDVTRELYAETAYSDMPMRQLLGIASQALIDPSRAIDPDALPDLTERERQVFSTLQDFFVSLGTSLQGDVDAEEVVVDAVQQLRDDLIVEPQLSIRTIALCSRVMSFGDYDEITNRTFLASRNTRFGLYIEVENYHSELNRNNEWVTELSREIIIYTDRDGIPVAKEDWSLAVDTAKHRRTDFFLAQLVELPPSLGVGKYHLKIRIRDEKTGSIAEDAIDFTLVADEKLVGG